MQLIIGIHARLHGVQTDATWIAEFRCVEQVNQPAQVGLQAIGPLVVDAIERDHAFQHGGDDALFVFPRMDKA